MVRLLESGTGGPLAEQTLAQMLLKRGGRQSPVPRRCREAINPGADEGHCAIALSDSPAREVQETIQANAPSKALD
jgi:hypothetical protein